MAKKSKKLHPHPKSDTLLVILLPADEQLEVEFKLIESGLEPMQKLVGGYIERVLSSIVLPCGCNTNLVVNEEGLIEGLAPNSRATRLVTREIRREMRDPIRGDAFLVGEGPVLGSEGVSNDWFSLPPNQDVVKFVTEEVSHA